MQKTAYEMRISDWSSDVCSSDLLIRLWPVLNISGLPPALAISSNSTWLAFTSAMMVEPGSSFSTSRASSARSWSPDRKSDGEGESVAVGVDLGGRRSVHKKN